MAQFGRCFSNLFIEHIVPTALSSGAGLTILLQGMDSLSSFSHLFKYYIPTCTWEDKLDQTPVQSHRNYSVLLFLLLLVPESGLRVFSVKLLAGFFVSCDLEVV